VCKGWTKRESANLEFLISNFNPIIQVRGAVFIVRILYVHLRFVNWLKC